MVDGTAALPSKMIRSTGELLVVVAKKTNVFPNKEGSSEKTSELPSQLDFG
jgi:hypothetical protein